MKQMNGILIIFDVTDRKSFENVSSWLKSVNEISLSNTSVIIVGNKIDLNESRVVEYKEGEELAHKNKLFYYEASAMEGKGIADAFEAIINKCISKLMQRRETNRQMNQNVSNEINIKNISNKNNDKKKQKSKCICN